VAVAAGDPGGLKRAIREILGGSEVPARLAAKREEVLPRYVHALDGLASRRVAVLLKRLIQGTEASGS
jgi:hypothetical protein